jgi:uncharacterized protein HemX
MKSRIVAALVLALTIGAGAAVSGKAQNTNSPATGNSNMGGMKHSKHRKHRKHRRHSSTKAATANSNK